MLAERIILYYICFVLFFLSTALIGLSEAWLTAVLVVCHTGVFIVVLRCVYWFVYIIY